METYRGIPVLERIAIGKIFFYDRRKDTPYKEEIEDMERELDRLEQARGDAENELDILFRAAAQAVGNEEAKVFSGHRMLLRDPMYLDYIRDRIRTRRVNAEYAVSDAQAHFARMFMEMDDEYMKSRASDVADVSGRLLRLLSGGPEQEGPDEPSILVADELLPSETMRFDKSMILALAVRRGSVNSHTAILARSMNIPAITGIDVQKDWAGRMAVVDGCTGSLILDPDEECLARMRRKQAEIEENDMRLHRLRGAETVTRRGRKIHLYANIGDLTDMDAVLANDAEGIGLFRSEFLFLQSETWPSREEQFVTYRAVTEAMRGKKVVIRTLDIGADKQAPYFDLPEESRSAAGSRGIRICLERPEIFRTQLKAILQAAAYGTVSVMFPMISSLEEMRACRQQMEIAKEELAEENIPFGEVETGIMIETPDAVRISSELAGEADFFCIGTNDLIQYILAADRRDAKGGSDFDPHHPAVIRAIRETITNAHAAGIWVGICGEMAADTTMTKTLVEMGVDEFSVAPALLLKVREVIRQLE